MTEQDEKKMEGRELLDGDNDQSWFGIPSGIKSIVLAVVAAVLGVMVLCAVGFLVMRSATPGGVEIVDRTMITKKAVLDKRQYEYAKFSNGLEVVSVSDSATVSSGFSVAVEAGSYYDPKDVQGLAHFCEHMLFLGTQKYPDPTGFDNYLQMHGGYNNAYTAEEKTVYYAQLDKEGFQEGLDRFADFFRAPLFDRKYVQKEVHAIDSEHAKNKQSPEWRIMRIIESLASEDSAESTFSTGNMETLYTKPQEHGKDTVNELKKYYEQNYCPPRMKLVTFGQDSTGDQIQQAFEKFSDIISGRDCKEEPQSFLEPKAYPPENLKKFVHVKGVTPQGQLWLMFPMPDLTKQYKTHPASYLKHILSYSGENSLEHTLKEDLGLATSVSADSDDSSALTKFWVVFELTEEGRKDIKKVLNTFFFYVSLMQKHGIDMPLYKSLGAVRELQWNWAEQSEITDTVMGMSEGMTRMSKEDLLIGDSLIQWYDPGLAQAVMDQLTPNNMIATYVDPDFDATRGKYDQDILDASPIRTDPYYEAEFSVMDLTTIFGGGIDEAWSAWLREDPTSANKSYTDSMGCTPHHPCSITFGHPSEITDIPQGINLDFAKAPKGRDPITSIYGNPPKALAQKEINTAKQVFYRQGSMSESPKVHLKFLLRTEAQPLDSEMTIRDSVAYSLYQSMLQEQMAPKLVDLEMTGISYTADASPHALSFSFSGFKNNLDAMMEKVFSGFNTGVERNEKRFERLRKELEDSLTDYSDMPIHYAAKDRNLLLQKNGHSNEEIAMLVKHIEEDDVIPVGDTIKKGDYSLTTLLMGNFGEGEGAKLQTDFEKYVNAKITVPISNVQTIEPVVNPDNRVEVRKTNPRKGDPNHVTMVTIQYGVPDTQESVQFGILSQVLGPAVYDELRTNQQLGYVVQGGISMRSNVLEVNVMVQGDQKLPDEIEPQIEMVLTKIMTQKLKDMTEEQFSAYKASYAKQLLEPPLGFSDEIGHYWGQIVRNNKCNKKSQQILAYLKEQLVQDELTQAWNKIIAPDEKRSKVVIKYFSDSLKEIPAPMTGAQFSKELKDLGVPKDSIDLFAQEVDRTVFFDKVDSGSRRQLLQKTKNKYWPQKLLCHGGTATSSLAESTSLLQTASSSGHTSAFRKKSKQGLDNALLSPEYEYQGAGI